MDNKTRSTLAGVFVILAVAMLLTAIYAMLTDKPSLKWGKGLVLPAFILSLGASRMRRKARGGD